MGGWLENWRVIPISAFNSVIVEVVTEIGKKISVVQEESIIFEGGGKLNDGVNEVADIYPDSLKDAPDVSWSKEDSMRTGTRNKYRQATLPSMMQKQKLELLRGD